jgi:hypothetical protein
LALWVNNAAGSPGSLPSSTVMAGNVPHTGVRKKGSWFAPGGPIYRRIAPGVP